MPTQAREIVRGREVSAAGERGFASVIAHFSTAPCRRSELYRAVNVATMVVVQFECAEAIERADEIFAVEGVDMALFGTNDLTADMGIPGDYENPRVRDAYARAIAAAKKHGKHVGVGGLGARPKLTAEFVEMGARYVSTGTDLGFCSRRDRAGEAGAGAGDMMILSFRRRGEGRNPHDKRCKRDVHVIDRSVFPVMDSGSPLRGAPE